VDLRNLVASEQLAAGYERSAVMVVQALYYRFVATKVNIRFFRKFWPFFTLFELILSLCLFLVERSGVTEVVDHMSKH
jgi:hypothetical protein